MKAKYVLNILFAFVLLTVVSTPAWASEVVQGKCLENNTEKQTLSLEEYDTNFSKDAPYGNSSGIISTFDLRNSKVGIFPEPGDILRIAYNIVEDKKVALKVMNVSKQDLRKK